MEINHDVFASYPQLKTKRLVLRQIIPEDAQAIFEMRANGRVNQFIPRPTMTDLENAKLLVEKTNEAYTNKQGIGFAGVLRDNQKIIGTCGFTNIESYNLHAEIGGEMATEYWGKHIAQEAVEAILNFGLNTLNLQTIEAKVSPNNRGAIYVLEQFGFVKEAHFKNRIYRNNVFEDMAIYTLQKESGF